MRKLSEQAVGFKRPVAEAGNEGGRRCDKIEDVIASTIAFYMLYTMHFLLRSLPENPEFLCASDCRV